MTIAKPQNLTLQDFLRLPEIEASPAWMIEILSPNQSQTKVTGNILHCLRHGTRLGWLIRRNDRSLCISPIDFQTR